VTQGQDLRLGELFYLYDKLVSASSIGQGSLSRAFETYLAQSIAAGQETIAK